MSGHITGGQISKIKDFPHSAFLAIGCSTDQGDGYFSCGSSILTQDVLLTAGHCFVKCGRNTDAVAMVGHEEIAKGGAVIVLALRKHEYHNEHYLSNDLALVLLNKDLTFSNNIRRVGILRQPPIVRDSTIAGWGKTNHLPDVSSILMSARQHILPRPTCLFTVNNPDGTFCAESIPGQGYLSRADSGSALVTSVYVQIGLVSYKVPRISKKITVYTDISYFYDWIQINSHRLYCEFKTNLSINDVP